MTASLCHLLEVTREEHCANTLPQALFLSLLALSDSDSPVSVCLAVSAFMACLLRNNPYAIRLSTISKMVLKIRGLHESQIT